MSKRHARSWKLILASTVALVAGAVVALNVGSTAFSGPVAAPSDSPSAKASGSPKTSPSTGPTCNPGPSPVCVPPTGKPSGASPSGSVKPSTSPKSSPTPGGGTTFKSTISIDYSNKKDSFTGRVKSANPCEKGRRVDLFQVRPGKDVNLGHTVTTKKGKYVIPFPKPNGRFYTKVKSSTAGRQDKCKGATSKTISE